MNTYEQTDKTMVLIDQKSKFPGEWVKRIDAEVAIAEARKHLRCHTCA